MSMEADNAAVVITVHGTFAGKPGEQVARWWQTDAALATRLTTTIGARVEAFKWQDKDGPGPNRESERRIAGQQLLSRLSALDADGTHYHLVGHSHGGSVIWHALKLSARANTRLSGLRSWTTVGTPFIEFGSDGSWLRHALAALAAVAALYLMGFWQLVGELAISARQGHWPLLIDRLPLSHELADLHSALGDWLYYGLMSGAAALVLFFAIILLLPAKDLLQLLITARREQRARRLAADWYEPSWLGLLHPADEAMAGLKATLIKAPDLVLRRRRGLRGLLLSLVKPAVRPVDEFAWTTLMKNAQGDDIVGQIVRRVASAPEPFTRVPAPLPDAVVAKVTARADDASARVLTRLRERIAALSDQADVAALVQVMSGTYEGGSLIHTSMFDEPQICDMVAAHVEGVANGLPQAGSLTSRSASPPVALTVAKAAAAAGLVVLVTLLAVATYRILIYPETNMAAAEAILARFDDPAYRSIIKDDMPGQALVRARRLGISFDRAIAAAGKLEEPQSKSSAYQLLMRELVATGRTSELLSLVTSAPQRQVPAYLHVDYLGAALVSSLEALVSSSRVASPEDLQLLQITAQQITFGLKGDATRNLLGRLVPVGVVFNHPDVLGWMARVREGDPDCKTWDTIVQNTASVITTPQQAGTLEAIIRICNPKTGAEDKQRMLRRIAVGALRTCDLAADPLKQASFHRAGKDAPVPPHFIECLARDRKDDAGALALEERRLRQRTTDTAELRAIWQMSKALKAGGLTAEAAQWAELAIGSATEPDRQEDKERDTVRQFANDALKLEILAATDPARHDAFLAQLSKSAEAFNDSRDFSPAWAALRLIHATYAERRSGRDCIIREADLRIVQTIIGISAYYPEKNPSAVATAILSLADRCRIEMYDGLLAETIRIVSGNNVSADRARYIAMTAPFQSNLRKAMATADTAALPPDILRGYVAAVDRHRPSTLPPVAYSPVAHISANDSPRSAGK
jgi:hypothetical protein